MGRLIDELRRRGVFRPGAAYLAVAWLVLQILDVVGDIFVLPDWIGQFTFIALIIGFPFAVALAWAYDLTPEGVKATDDIEAPQRSAPFGGRKIDFVIIGALSLVIVLLVVDNYVVSPERSIASDRPPIVSGYNRLTQSPVMFPPVSSQVRIVPGGSRIYFNDWEAGRMGLRQLSINGGESIRIPQPFDGETTAVLHAMTPDNDHLLLNATTLPDMTFSLWLWPVVGGNARKLGLGAYGLYSPNGSRLFYTDGGLTMYLANADLTESSLLGTAPGHIHWPLFSPDGSRIRFNVEGAYRAIWQISADGSDLQPVLPEWQFTNHCCGSWTLDGKYFVFQATRNYRTQLWAIHEPKGLTGTQSTPIQITTGALDFRRPTISVDGKTIFAFSWQLRGEVVRYDKEIEHFVSIPGLESLSAEWLSYSRDEEWLAYVSYPEQDLWRSRSDGSQRLQLTHPPMRVAEPYWSPDGQTLAFSGRMPGREWNIYTVSADGGAPRPVASENRQVQSHSWSPDGKSLAFRAEDKDRVQILEVATGMVSGLDGTEGLYLPHWSPDGQYLAVVSNGALKLFDLTTGLVKTLVENVELESLYWANDSQYVYYYDLWFRGDDRSLYRVNIKNNSLEKVVKTGDVRTAWGVSGMWVGVAPDGAALLLRDMSIHHVYALDWLPE